MSKIMQRGRFLSDTAGAFLLAMVSLAILSGCASGPMETAHKVHSYTPCGMMMNAVMDHPQACPHHPEEVGEPGVEADATEAPESSAGASAGHAH
ncbi:MAG: hypothetical protein C4520_12250 [Candidatus Abyssobacteria bacterium SURF_5]|uniref:Lipoprotein n=1 Tax=Abyssobacteria bacterium (strain SURF_5) TaxID=2093360 RepID=A0A3A4NG07_ABYX5|nr:MAG: hypothetical protein C4520_12250 [Candidatus Abyssubacteria bacterium SURF_5]